MNYVVIDVDHAVDTDAGGTSGGLVLASKNCDGVVPLPDGILGEFHQKARNLGCLHIAG